MRDMTVLPVPRVISHCCCSLTTIAVMVTSMAVLTTSVVCHAARHSLGTVCLVVMRLTQRTRTQTNKHTQNDI